MPSALAITPHQVHAWLCANPGTHSAAAIGRAMGVKPNTIQRRLHACVTLRLVRRTGGVKGPGVVWEAI